jgi:hypothetical protein
MRTEKSRLRRSLMSLRALMRRIRHDAIKKQVAELNAVLRGHYAYYGIAGNIVTGPSLKAMPIMQTEPYSASSAVFAIFSAAFSARYDAILSGSL